MAIKIKLQGFEEIIRAIETAGGNIDKATEEAMQKSATVMNDTLKSEMDKAGVPSDLVGAMPPPEVKKEGNRISVGIGYRKGNYNPENLSDGYKVVFLNYGTPNRTKHGKITARGFIQKAKKKASPQIKKAQKEAYDAILEKLNNET